MKVFGSSIIIRTHKYPMQTVADPCYIAGCRWITLETFHGILQSVRSVSAVLVCWHGGLLPATTQQ
jgi:hypothetical protein